MDFIKNPSPTDNNKEKKKKSWTFLQIQLPLHHLIQSNEFAFCLHPMFRGPVNKTGGINLMCLHGSACKPPAPLFATLYLEYLNSHESVNAPCVGEIKSFTLE